MEIDVARREMYPRNAAATPGYLNDRLVQLFRFVVAAAAASVAASLLSCPVRLSLDIGDALPRQLLIEQVSMQRRPFFESCSL